MKEDLEIICKRDPSDEGFLKTALQLDLACRNLNLTCEHILTHSGEGTKIVVLFKGEETDTLHINEEPFDIQCHA